MAALKTASIFSRSGVALGKAMKGSPAKSAGLSFFSLVSRWPLGSTATQFMVSTGSTWMPGLSPDSMARPVSQKPELIQLCTALALPEWIETMTSGYSVLNAATMRASRPPARRGMAATLRRLALNERMLAAADSRPARPMKVFSTS
ncbi:Uncharacterised protein [Achromobacter xylosoxidans]|nr:Uncharacterised protein [Achromobacter xylosoxidans]CUJ76727.1 Uncharacterised protein [Achromobacter xylosoxidans]